MDDASPGERRGGHAPLHALHQRDVLGLEHVVHVGDGLQLGPGGLGGLEEEVVGLTGAARTVGDDVHDDEVAPSRVAHEAGVGPQPPHGMVGDGGPVDGVGGVGRAAGLGHVAGPEAVGGDLVGVHVDQGAEVPVGDRAVVALQEVVDHVLPVRLDLVGESVGVGEVGHVGGPVGDLGCQVAGQVDQWGGPGVEVDVDEATELLDGQGIEADGQRVEVDQVVGVGGGPEATVEAVGPGVVRAGDPADGAVAGEQFVGPMHAHVGERPQRAVIVADHHH